MPGSEKKSTGSLQPVDCISFCSRIQFFNCPCPIPQIQKLAHCYLHLKQSSNQSPLRLRSCQPRYDFRVFAGIRPKRSTQTSVGSQLGFTPWVLSSNGQESAGIVYMQLWLVSGVYFSSWLFHEQLMVESCSFIVFFRGWNHQAISWFCISHVSKRKLGKNRHLERNTWSIFFASGIPFPLQKPVSWDPYKDSVRPCSVEIFVGVTPVFVVLRYFCRHFCLVQKRCSNCMNLEVGSPGKPRSFL